MLHSVVVHSEDPSPEEASRELARAARAAWQPKSPPRIGLLFVSGAMDPAPYLRTLRKTFPGMRIVGCSSDGEMSREKGHHTDSAVLALLDSDTIRFEPFVCTDIEQGPEASMERGLSGPLAGAEPPALGLVFAEALARVGGDAIVGELRRRVGDEVPLFGALAADDWCFKKTTQFLDETVHQGAVVGLLLFGPVEVGYGVESGWRPLGPPVRIDRSEGNSVHRIDGMTASAYYDSLVGRAPDMAGGYPLLFEQGSSRYLRAPLQEADGSILFAGLVPEGVEAMVSTATPKQILAAAAESASEAAAMLAGPPDFVLLISCAARHYVLGAQARREIGEALGAFGPEVPVAGLYGYGEIAPFRGADGQHSLFYNEAFVCMALREGAA